MNHHGEMKWCISGRHMAPTKEFRPLPGMKARKEVCARCYEIIMQARKRNQAAVSEGSR